MANVISSIVLTNMAFHQTDNNQLPRKVEVSRNLDDKYLVNIKIGEWETNISKEDLRRIL